MTDEIPTRYRTPAIQAAALPQEAEQAMAQRLKEVRQAIEQAAHAAGRHPEEITLIGVSKFFPAAAAISAVRLGLLDLGENRVQEMLGKQAELAPLDLNPRWHLIGTLQKNKVKYIIGRTALIHSVDSFDLLEEISRRSQQAGVVTPVLIQVNTAGETSKHGFTPASLPEQAAQLGALPNIQLCGLMTMAPLFDNAEETLPVFAETRDLFLRLQADHPEWPEFKILSMGMSQDFVQAIACGATHIRIGTAIFGARTINPTGQP